MRCTPLPKSHNRLLWESRGEPAVRPKIFIFRAGSDRFRIGSSLTTIGI
jgi:hypothetical protein